MPIRIGVSERNGSFYSQGIALKEILDRVPQLRPVEIVESAIGASIENAELLDAGNIEFGFVSMPWVAAATRAGPPFSRSIDLRTVLPMNVGPNFFVARADSELRSVSDLRGRRVAVGLTTGGMVHHAEAVFSALGFAPRDIERVYANFADGAELLATGQVDAQYQCPPPNKVMTELSERVPVRVLSFVPEQLQEALRAIPYDRAVIMRKGIFRGVDNDLPQLGVVNLLVTHARMSQVVVGDVVAAVLDHAEELKSLLPLFHDFPHLLATMRQEHCAFLQFDDVKIHPGAAALYARRGYLR